jgi:hypothetical protein
MKVTLNLPIAFNLPQLVNQLRPILKRLQDVFTQIPKIIRAEAYSASVAGDPFLVPHTLGEIPTDVCGTVSADGYIYVTDADRAVWSKTHVQVRASVADAKVTLRIFKDD